MLPQQLPNVSACDSLQRSACMWRCLESRREHACAHAHSPHRLNRPQDHASGSYRAAEDAASGKPSILGCRSGHPRSIVRAMVPPTPTTASRPATLMSTCGAMLPAAGHSVAYTRTSGAVGLLTLWLRCGRHQCAPPAAVPSPSGVDP
jgi:hypothetical protein